MSICDFCGTYDSNLHLSKYRYQPSFGSVQVFCSHSCLENYKLQLVTKKENEKIRKAEIKENRADERNIQKQREIDQEKINREKRELKEEQKQKDISDIINATKNFFDSNKETYSGSTPRNDDYSIVNCNCVVCGVTITELYTAPENLVTVQNLQCPTGHTFSNPYFGTSLELLLASNKVIRGVAADKTKINLNCPHCNLKITRFNGSVGKLINSDRVKCPKCKNNFKNPYFKGYGKQFLGCLDGTINFIWKAIVIFWVVLVILWILLK